ncbi:hypothetical protein N1030_06620 [Desulfovibrio mangrovi]|uniref:hypothetical protein n=1 Tax=Desulfovibrio mangrovi TaxID=2976983 RepID=UPI0022456026|nr:hypothetical protein [Desulfovibrio mangrovi]UZP68640.1 hypothetical protein N1030_06620 [Desulfovibrio mangrovi]
MGSSVERFMAFLRMAHKAVVAESDNRFSHGGARLTASVMDEIFFLSLEDGWMGFARTAYSFSAVACMAALALFVVSGTVGQGTYIDRVINGLLYDPAGLFTLYYMEF